MPPDKLTLASPDHLRAVLDRAMRYTVKSDCWVCSLYQPNGYPFITGALNGTPYTYRVMRLAYHVLRGPIPDGLVLDHLCRNRACINPDHLEPVTDKENLRRGNGVPARNARKTHCKRGHPFAGDNLALSKKGRECRACSRLKNKRLRQKTVAGRVQLTPEQVLDIRARAAHGEGNKAIRDRYGVNSGTVYKIIRRESWPCLT